MYSFESAVQFIEIIAAPTSRSNLKFFVVDYDKLTLYKKVRKALQHSALRHCGFPLTILQSSERHLNLQDFVMSRTLPKSLLFVSRT